MSTTKHEWIALQTQSEFGGWAVFTRNGNYSVLDTTAPGCSPQTSKERALLMAAAPTLLEACKQTAYWLEETYAQWGDDEGAKAELARLQSAIREAEEETR